MSTTIQASVPESDEQFQESARQTLAMVDLHNQLATARPVTGHDLALDDSAEPTTSQAELNEKLGKTHHYGGLVSDEDRLVYVIEDFKNGLMKFRGSCLRRIKSAVHL